MTVKDSSPRLLVLIPCAVLGLCLPFVSPVAGASMVYVNEYLTEEDTVITSRNYPNSYPPNQNVTWWCSSPTDKWAVVFLDFQLESTTENDKNYDWLELDDGRKLLRYSAFTRPHLPYRSSGHQLRMTFVTDSVSGGKAKGFKVQLLHGKDDQEISIKIHAVNKRKTEDEDDEGNNHLLLIIMVVVAVILLVAIALTTVLCFLYHRRRANIRTMALTDSGRDAYGVRRNSGVFHSRNSGRDAHTSEVVIVARQTHRVPSDNQQSRPNQMTPVQRSNSQRDWRARAELCAMVTVSSQNSRPNMYSHSGAQPQACGGREPDKVPDFTSFDDCCKKSRKNSQGGHCNDAACSTARKNNPYHLNNDLSTQNPSVNQSACASLSKSTTEKKCNNNDYTNISFSQDSNSTLSSQDARSPVYCNSPVSPPNTSPDILDVDGFTLNVRVGSLGAGPASPTDNCYENVSAYENQGREDKNLQAESLYINSPDVTHVKRKVSNEVNCQRTRQDEEFKTMPKSQGEFKCLHSDGLESILEVKRNRPPSINLYSNWENIQKDGKEVRMLALHETKVNTEKSSLSSTDIHPDDAGAFPLTSPSAEMEKHEGKREERKISDPTVHQMNTKVPKANPVLCSANVKSSDISEDINHSVPCHTGYEPVSSSSRITSQFSLELPAVNTGEYLYLTEFGISPHKPEKEGEKNDVSFTDLNQLNARVPNLSTSQSITSEEGEYRLIPSSQERCKNEEFPNARALPLNAKVPKPYISASPSSESSGNNSGEYHQLPLNKDESIPGMKNTDHTTAAESRKPSMETMELQLSAKVPKPRNNNSLSSPSNSVEYHFLPSSSHDKPSTSMENELNVRFSPPPIASFPPPEMKDNSNEGEYHHLPPCNKTNKDNQQSPEGDTPKLGSYELGISVPTVNSPSVVENPNDYYMIPRTTSVDINSPAETEECYNSTNFQLSSQVPVSKNSPGDKVNGSGDYHYLVTSRRNDEQDSRQNLKTDGKEMSKINVNQLNVGVPKPSHAQSPDNGGAYHLLPIRD